MAAHASMKLDVSFAAMPPAVQSALEAAGGRGITWSGDRCSVKSAVGGRRVQVHIDPSGMLAVSSAGGLMGNQKLAQKLLADIAARLKDAPGSAEIELAD